MSEQYSHTLIAKPKDFTPSHSQVQRFYSAMVSQNVLPGIPETTLRIPTGKFREWPYKDPFTGQNMRAEIKDRKKLLNVEEISKALESLKDYELEASAVGRPGLPPLAIEFGEPYHVGVTCFVYSEYRSTSDPQEQPADGEKVFRYRTRCSELPKVGIFHNPHNMEVIRVPEAGYARFWIQFELGKFLFPEIKNGNLEILNPRIVAEAENVFGIGFVQGCCWG